ncbi:hypothetical protein SAMN04488543_2860 [Friedmanniella luteola]|uniref:MinD-like ATPase involved in chromosome partitioning or flagellar assembly n=1 Tax=Friedmanniella luteola TaxID=546871 RepID=A0A1H1WYG3_9ACTN|nr:hypothetical protein [Friedmanniella luteola]SDT02114.1 hypothetical protein SAMN04488543_2860 [Friedmanniella luteola]
MAVVVLVSAAGSPGVTTSALGLALGWPRPVVVVEADPTGGSAVLAGYFRGATAPAGGLLDLASAEREGRLAEALPSVLVPVPDSTVQLLPGVRAHGQARSLAGLWHPLAGVLSGLEALGQDVIVDGGRLGLEGWPEPLLAGADLVLLAVRSDLVSLAAARSWADTLRTGHEHAGGAGVGLLLVGAGRPYSGREISAVLQLPVTAGLAWDEGSAAVLSRGAVPARRFDRLPLPRSLSTARAAVEAQVAAGRAALESMPVEVQR